MGRFEINSRKRVVSQTIRQVSEDQAELLFECEDDGSILEEVFRPINRLYASEQHTADPFLMRSRHDGE
jgi:hypothetical protein